TGKRKRSKITNQKAYLYAVPTRKRLIIYSEKEYRNKTTVKTYQLTNLLIHSLVYHFSLPTLV
ncbi:MAG: hypothetical protein EAZ95_05835, partial [Bacteroidetes bacterium]